MKTQKNLFQQKKKKQKFSFLKKKQKSQLCTNDIFERIETELQDEFQTKIDRFNDALREEKIRVLGVGNKIIDTKKIAKIRKALVYLDSIKTLYTIEDFVKFAVKTSSKHHTEKFPPLHKILAKVGVWQTVVKNNSLPMYIFWPTTTTNTGKIYEKGSDKYYGFNTNDILVEIKESFVYILVQEVIKAYDKQHLVSIKKEDIERLELVLASAIRYRDEYGDMIPKLYQIWKLAITLPNPKEKPIKEKIPLWKMKQKKSDKLYSDEEYEE